MSDWRERLQSGTIGGLTFHTERASGSGGRRLVVHEYPLQDIHYVEDLGKSAGSGRITIFFIGQSYDIQRDELIALLDSEGPHSLVHPHLGTLRVHIRSYEWAITTRKGGFVQFNLEYVLDGQRKFPQSGNANAQQLQTACDSCATALQNSFAEQFTVKGKPGFIETAAQGQFSAALSQLESVNNQLSTVTLGASPYIENIQQFNAELSALLQQPGTLAGRVISLVSSVIGSGTNIMNVLHGYRSLLASFLSIDAVPLTTATRRHQATNQATTQQLLSGITTIGTARLIAGSNQPFVTYNQAIDTRDLLLQQLDTLIDNGTDAEYYPLVDLQTALMKRVDDVAPGLDQVKQIQLQQSVPALVLAHQLYGDANKADELVNRNGVTHPSFIPAGKNLEVLS